MSVVLNCVVDEDKEVGEAAALKAGVIVFQASKEGGAVPATSFLILNAARAFLLHRTNRFVTGVCVHKHHRRFLPPMSYSQTITPVPSSHQFCRLVGNLSTTLRCTRSYSTLGRLRTRKAMPSPNSDYNNEDRTLWRLK
jgi:hypothetical protein